MCITIITLASNLNISILKIAIYNKSKILYNLNNALDIMKMHKKNDIYIVEGYLDALTCNFLKMPAVALCGSALNAGHLTLLSKYINEKTNIHIMLDNDDAGTKASIRSYHIMMKYGFIDCKVTRLYNDYKDINETYSSSITNKERKFSLVTSEALDFCLENEIDNATSIKERQAKLKLYTDYMNKTGDKFIKDYFNAFLEKYENKKEDKVISFFENCR